MRMLSYAVAPEYHGMNVQTFARKILGLSARVFIKQKYVKNGMQINGVHCRSIDLLEAGDIFTISLLHEETAYEPADLPVEICWESEDYLVFNKPAGMPVHPSPGHDRDSLLNAAAHHCQRQNFLFRPLYRLDKDTSGLVVVAKSRLAASCAALEKKYYAVCEGVLEGCGTISCAIGRKEGSKIQRETGHGDAAVTHWQAMKNDGSHSLLRLCLETGRTHQIRVHLSAMGYPLAGDDLYAGSKGTVGRQALHCKELSLHCAPLLVEREIKTPFPEDLRQAFPALCSD